jgi:hypothetical protein
MKTKIINLTPHPINIAGLGEIKPSGKIARLEEKLELIETIEVQRDDMISVAYVPIMRKLTGGITGLPEPEPNVVYVVSFPVAQQAVRRDVLAIGESIRDGNGNIIGCKSLAVV